MMSATKIDGLQVSKTLLNKYSQLVAGLKEKKIYPKLVVITLGEDPASQVYVGQKEKKAKQIGLDFEWLKLREEISPQDLKQVIDALNEDASISGIIVQLPLPEGFNPELIASWIDPSKDVDGLSPLNMGKLLKNQESLLPCTPKGILKLFEVYEVDLVGKDITVIGKSQIVGMPLAVLLTYQGATVSLCHSRTKNLKDKCIQSDIIISAVGSPNLVTEDMVKDQAIIIDVGINRLDNGKLVGDVDYQAVEDKVAMITPVPGGVGPMTVAMLIEQTLIAACNLAGADYQDLWEGLFDE